MKVNMRSKYNAYLDIKANIIHSYAYKYKAYTVIKANIKHTWL